MEQKEIVRKVTQEMGRTLHDPVIPDGWHDHYTPEQARMYAAELDGLCSELDAGFLGWRTRKPFADLPLAKVAWIKVRILRVRQIVTGSGAHGVRESWQARRDDIDGNPIEGRVFAATVRPSFKRTPCFDPIVCVVALADESGLPLAKVREAIAARPQHRRDVRAWLAEWSTTEGAVDAPQADSPPPSSPPEVN